MNKEILPWDTDPSEAANSCPSHPATVAPVATLPTPRSTPASSASAQRGSQPPTPEPSDSVWDVFKELRKESQRKRADNREYARLVLEASGHYFEVKNDGAHLIVDAALGKIDYWPGTGLWICRYGPRGRGLQPLMQHLSKF